MNNWLKVATLAAIASLLISPASMAAKAKPKPKPKAPVKSKAVVPHIVLGTTQLKGEDNPQFGVTYTLGKSNPINITLRSAEYTVEPVRVGNDTYIANTDEKLLILHMTYHNPQKSDRFVRWDSFRFTIVDPKDKNHDGLKDLGTDEKVSTSFSMNMKPAQRNEVFGVMKVPAEGEMPKLIIKGSDDLVLRYDLHGKVKGLPELYADPADKTGATALAKIAATPGTYYPVGMFNFKLNKVEYTSATVMGDAKLAKDQRFLVVSFNLKNISAKPNSFRWDGFKNKVIDVDGVEVARCSTDVFQASKDKSFSSNMDPDQEMSLRYIYKIPNDTDLKMLTIAQGDGRTLEFDISGVK